MNWGNNMNEYQEWEQVGDSEDEILQKLYCIHLEQYKQQGRSFITFARSRLCSLSHDAKTNKSETNLINTFKQCCSKQDEFFPPNIPLRELIFRIFLSNGNQPLTLQQILYKVQHHLRYSGSQRIINIEMLMRMVENDSYYAIAPLIKNE